MLGVVLVRTALQALNDITEGLSSITGYQVSGHPTPAAQSGPSML